MSYFYDSPPLLSLGALGTYCVPVTLAAWAIFRRARGPIAGNGLARGFFMALHLQFIVFVLVLIIPRIAAWRSYPDHARRRILLSYNLSSCASFSGSSVGECSCPPYVHASLRLLCELAQNSGILRSRSSALA